MDEKLLMLRDSSYATVKNYDGAVRKCTESLGCPNYQSCMVKQRVAGLEYGTALAKLLDHLEHLPSTPAIEDEKTHSRKLLDLLDRELEAVEQLLPLAEKTS